MNPRILKKNYLRLLTLFEVNLKTYHPIFNDVKYELRYNITNYRFQEVCSISVEMITRITSNSFTSRIKEENINRLFATYCRYFSINHYKIVEPFENNNIIDNPNYKTIPINKRITLSNDLDIITQEILED